MSKLNEHYYSKGVLVGILLQNFFIWFSLFVAFENIKSSFGMIIITTILFSVASIIYYYKHSSKIKDKKVNK